MSTAELATSYAALILADDNVEITADKINTLIKAAGVQEVEPIWAQLFAKPKQTSKGEDRYWHGTLGKLVSKPTTARGGRAATMEDSAAMPNIFTFDVLPTPACNDALEGKEVKDLLSNVGSGGGAAAPAAGGAAGGAAAAAEETKEEEKVEEKEESDDDMGFGLFD
ncbi:large subunit ribosomal protein LP1 [Sporothrix schenckii 1099-18]|uniref:Large ribosomal subunit protein P1 n=1 Tax=Sporothrix schenckii 1099-18 TaxID=1397361 RepID=A0A0F2LX59_SPOSC|nr:large subunit ribosomal protein LP1 [Sporothrix schenckii 1099-18]KJR81085.1 large subunit ribosomal protein LP1 [Sporothrix schenckii 1099-18]